VVSDVVVEASVWLPYFWVVKMLQAHTEFMNELMVVLT
jgi:hypothetical protein